ncbi:unnamed protein product [Moneuplotes crassus]|uniref:tRNA (guanine(26)-N(2))-dimethyltransferase n=1 Tax=Euplotes crassus TaxID=5936 RepID=A0AAD1UFB6_EUPCR|nr:unnamed protein product [Moneuplotes crassus]
MNAIKRSFSKLQKPTNKSVPQGYKLLTEGSAQVLYYHNKDNMHNSQWDMKVPTNLITNHKKLKKLTRKEKNEARDTVFYNPAQEFNRDLSIMCISEYGKQLQERRELKDCWKGLKILEALAATGLRSCRYMKEISVDVWKILSNDWDPTAAELIKKNFEYNDIDKNKTEITAIDAIDLMYERRKLKDLYDVIDLDPYGTALPFLDSSIQAMKDGGLLCATFTDTAVLCTSKPHICYYKYDSVTTHQEHCHEFALRMVLHTIATIANRYQKQIFPMLSLTADFYIRLFVRVGSEDESVLHCHDSVVNTSYVFQCTQCQNFHLHKIGRSRGANTKHKKNITSEEQSQRDRHHDTKFSLNPLTIPSKCEVCDSSMVIGGPIWTGEIHDSEFIEFLLKRSDDWKHLATYERIKKTIKGIQKEMEIGNYPLSMNYNQICSRIRASSIAKKHIYAAFYSLGYNIVQTYYNPYLYKTDAPHKTVYDIFKAWKVKSLEGTKRSLLDNCSNIAKVILNKPLEINPDFEYNLSQIEADLKKNRVRYSRNPPGWGPGTRATSHPRSQNHQSGVNEVK